MVMEANFRKALPLVLKHEGGFSNHKDDPGGATNKGITLENYRRYVKKNGTVADLKAITDEEVAKVYKLFYWDAVKGDLLPGGVDYAVFDFAVNSGPGRAIKFLQRIAGVAQDGAIGPVTVAAVSALLPEKVINQLCDDRLTFLKRLSIWPTFGKGWGRRVSDVRAHALGIAGMAAASQNQPAPASPSPARPVASAAPAEPSASAATGKSFVAVIIAGLAGAAAYFWEQITSLFGG
jgi:lysozyme family protein